MTDKIEYEVEISAKSSQEIRQLLKEIQEADQKVNNAKNIHESKNSQSLTEPKEEKKTDQDEPDINKQVKTLGKKVDDVEKTQLKQAEQIAKSTALSLAQGSNPISLGMGLFQKLVPFLGPFFIASGIVDVWMNYMFSDGGPWDRRYKPTLLTDVNNTITRQLKGQLRQGYAEVRVSSIANLRGGNNMTFTNLSAVNKGGIYSENVEMLGKGLS